MSWSLAPGRGAGLETALSQAWVEVALERVCPPPAGGNAARLLLQTPAVTYQQPGWP